jgi:hypothetical protein
MPAFASGAEGGALCEVYLILMDANEGHDMLLEVHG